MIVPSDNGSDTAKEGRKVDKRELSVGVGGSSLDPL